MLETEGFNFFAGVILQFFTVLFVELNSFLQRFFVDFKIFGVSIGYWVLSLVLLTMIPYFLGIISDIVMAKINAGMNEEKYLNRERERLLRYEQRRVNDSTKRLKRYEIEMKQKEEIVRRTFANTFKRDGIKRSGQYVQREVTNDDKEKWANLYDKL
jgi:hypothetical protein